MSAGMSKHTSPVSVKDEWLTPPWLLEKLGPFDLDPCAPVARPWDTAKRHYTIEDNGLLLPWEGRVWLNPPYDKTIGDFITRLRLHGNGLALIYARTDTELWQREVSRVLALCCSSRAGCISTTSPGSEQSTTAALHRH